MLDVLWRMLPVTLSVMASPVAILAVLGMLQSSHPLLVNVCYLGGWVVATSGSLVFWLAVLSYFGISEAHTGSALASALHASISVLCFAGAVWSYRRARATLTRLAAARTLDEFAAAAPQLPGLVKDSVGYGARRSFVVGLGVFLLNPTNVSLVAATAIDLLNAHVSSMQVVGLSIGFVVAVSLPLALPVIAVTAGRRAPDRLITRVRGWVLRNNGFIRASMLLVVGFLQLTRAVTGGPP
ncbi:GAP family protein [Gordonia liuliyuniae]|uniref:GAP family protein n=1 Tax=Gordonia liuliyuniae TaxID=2911517 RepID=A0ABS9IPL4_9ACTN|nr:GAP family protein [Gordonia liuliyuniae]MCF8587496.1 GAP family protein [Gordonia liuliyuniae]